MTITALPTPPTRDDPINFAERADDFVAALPVFVTEVNQTADSINLSETAAEAAAAAAAVSEGNALVSSTAAAAAAQTAATAAGASIWVSGTSYSVGDTRYSPLNGLIYRRLTSGAGTTDPANDGVNWLQISVGLPIVEVITTAAHTVVRSRHVVMTNTGQCTVTLPLNPRKDDTVFISFTNDRFDNVIITNGQPVMGVAGDLDVDYKNVTVQLMYVDATRGWRIV